MSCRFLALLFCFCSITELQADEAPARLLAQGLLAMTGTAAVFDSPRVQRALSDPEPFLGDAGQPRRERLVEEAGLKHWQPPRVWLLQSRLDGEQEIWESAAPLFAVSAQSRGYVLVDEVLLPAARDAIALLKPGTVAAGLGTLLDAYGVDVLVLVWDQSWSLWTRDRALQGSVPSPASLLPHVLAETLASLQQWPEAAGRQVMQVDGIGSLADFAGAQAALQTLPGLRQVQLIRVEAGTAWFAVTTDGSPAAMLAGDPRLASLGRAPGVQPAGVREGCQLACVLYRLEWRPEAPVPAGGR